MRLILLLVAIIVGCSSPADIKTDKSLKIYYCGDLATIDSEVQFKLPHLDMLMILDGQFLLVSKGYREISDRDIKILKRMNGVYGIKEYNLPGLMPD